MLASLTIFFFCAGNPGNESPTYPGFEVYYIKKKKKKVFTMVKKIAALSTLSLFFLYKHTCSFHSSFTVWGKV